MYTLTDIHAWESMNHRRYLRSIHIINSFTRDVYIRDRMCFSGVTFPIKPPIRGYNLTIIAKPSSSSRAIHFLPRSWLLAFSFLTQFVYSYIFSSPLNVISSIETEEVSEKRNQFDVPTFLP